MLSNQKIKTKQSEESIEIVASCAIS